MSNPHKQKSDEGSLKRKSIPPLPDSKRAKEHCLMHDGGPKKSMNTPLVEDVASTISSDTLVVFRKRFHFPNELVTQLPAKSDRAHLPPPGFFTVYEMTLRAGLRFPPAPELLEILSKYGISPSQLSHRSLCIIVGLIVYFREHHAVLTIDYLARLCKFSSDTSRRVSCRSNRKWLSLSTSDPPKNWISMYFFVKNDWGFQEKWEDMRSLPSTLHTCDEDVLRALKVESIDILRYDLHHMGQLIMEERLFKNNLSTQAGRTHAQPLKKPLKISEKDVSDKRPTSKRPEGGRSSKNGKEIDRAIICVPDMPLPTKGPGAQSVDLNASKGGNGLSTEPTERGSSWPCGIRVPEEILKRVCTGRRRSDELILRKMEIEAELDIVLNEWNQEFVKIKYQCGESVRRWRADMQEVSSLKDQLAQCRTEMMTMATSLSLRQQELDRSRDELMTSGAERIHLESGKKTLEEENQRLRDLLIEKESKASIDIGSASLKAVEDFKVSIEHRLEILDHIENARKKFLAVEAVELKKQYLEEGFTRGFLKGMRLVHRKTGVEVDGISMSEVSQDESSGSGGEYSDNSSDEASSEEIDIISL